MKKTGLIATLSLAFLCSANQALADTVYYGELCWNAGLVANDFSVLKLAVSDMGGGHILFNGQRIDDIPDNGKPELYSGNGEIVGDRVVFMLNVVTDEDEIYAAGTFYVSISLSTLSGTFRGTLTGVDKETQEVESQFGGGFFSPTPCPD